MENLPRGVLKSAFLPDEVKGGTKLFLSYENGKYTVHTRFETYARRKSLEKAEQFYNDVLNGKVGI